MELRYRKSASYPSEIHCERFRQIRDLSLLDELGAICPACCTTRASASSRLVGDSTAGGVG